jgi:hypothetical protein
MIFGVFLLSSSAIVGFSFFAIQQYKKRQERQLRENENTAAITIRDYARTVKTLLDESKRNGISSIGFQQMAVPTSCGYHLSIELSAHTFQIYGVPDIHNKTGRLSFYADHSLILKAADNGGALATAKDDAFIRFTADVFI